MGPDRSSSRTLAHIPCFHAGPRRSTIHRFRRHRGSRTESPSGLGLFWRIACSRPWPRSRTTSRRTCPCPKSSKWWNCCSSTCLTSCRLKHWTLSIRESPRKSDSDLATPKKGTAVITPNIITEIMMSNESNYDCCDYNVSNRH